MIQRIQTVYLLIVAALMIGLLLLSVSSVMLSNWLLLTIAGVTAGFSVLAIFLYKNRKTQIKVCGFIFLLLVAYYIAFMIRNIDALGGLSSQWKLEYPIVFPLVAILFVFLAIGGIKKDEKLIRSADRLR